jgi:hypothetical protein
VAARLWVELRSVLRPLPIALSLVCSYGLTQVLTAMSSVGHGPEHYYGAPIPVGTSDFDLIAGQLGPETFNPAIFILDVAITAGVLLFAGRRGGSVAVVVAAAAALASLVLVFFMYAKNLDFVGFPIPVSMRTSSLLPAGVLVWIDLVVWALAGGFMFRRGTRADHPAAL